MKNKIKWLIYLALTIFLVATGILCIPLQASASTGLVKLSSLSPGNTVNFGGYSWIVLNPGSGYLIMQNNYGSDRQFDPWDTNTFDPNDGDNIAYYLNNNFYNSLPSAYRALIQSHNWGIGADYNHYYQTGGHENSSMVNCKIGLMSYTEFYSYSSILGSPSTQFWTRTPVNNHDIHVYYIRVDQYDHSYNMDSTAAGNKASVRPALYLNPSILVSGGNGGNITPYNLVTSYNTTPSAGTPFYLTVSAKDAFGNNTTSYTGTVHFTSTDTNAMLPSAYTFVPGDKGVHTFDGVTLMTAGAQVLTVTDKTTAANTIIGTSDSLSVTETVSRLTVTTSTTGPTAGTPFTIKVTAEDTNGNTVTGYTGTVHFTSTDSNMALPGDYTFTPDDKGTHTFIGGVTLNTVGSQTVTATDTTATINTIAGTSGNLTVQSRPSSKSIPLSSLSTGNTINFGGYKWIVLDPKTGYLISKDFCIPRTFDIDSTSTFNPNDSNNIAYYLNNYFYNSFSSADKELVQSHNWTAGNEKNESASAVVSKIGLISYSEWNTYKSTLGNPPDWHFNWTRTPYSSGSDRAWLVGSDGNLYFLGTSVCLLYRPTLYLKPDVLVADGNGGNITPYNLTVSISDRSQAGVPFNVTVTAKDAYGNTAVDYTGTVHFTSSDANAVLPEDYTFVSGDKGSHTFTGVTLMTASVHSITVTDLSAPSRNIIEGTSRNLAVSPATADSLTVTTSTAASTAGTTMNVTVTVKDAYGNTATGYRGTVHFTSTDANAMLPEDYTFVFGDKGIHTFTGVTTLKTVGTQTVTVADTAKYSISGASGSLTVSQGEVSNLLVTTSTATPTAGTTFNIAVTAKDACGNTVTGYTGTVHFTSTDVSAELPADYTFVSDDNSTHTFIGGATLNTAGMQTVTASDTAMLSVTGTSSSLTVYPASFTVVVTANPTDGGTTTGGGIYTEGASITVTATPKSGYRFVDWTVGSNVMSTDASYTFTLGTTDVNLTANFVPIPALSIAVIMPDGIEGMTYSGSVSASGGVGPYTWSAEGLPSGLDINTVTGAVYGTPTVYGTYNVQFILTDSTNTSETKSVAITVAHVNQAPSVTVPASIAVTEDLTGAITGVSFSDPDAGSGVVTVHFHVPRGMLAANSDDGVSVSGLGPATLTLVGSITDINALIAAGSVTYTTEPDSTEVITMSVDIDDNGNTGVGGSKTGNGSTTITVNAVNDPAVIAITDTNNVKAAYNNNHTISLSGVISDAEKQTVEVSATIGGKTSTTTVDTDSTNTWILTWDISDLKIPEGTYTGFSINAVDTEGATVSATYDGDIVIDNKPPEVVFETNGSDTFVTTAQTTVSAVDTGSGIIESTLKYAWSTGTVEPTSGWLSFNTGAVLTNGSIDGEWYLHIQGSDEAGNRVHVVSNRFRVNNNIVPTVTLTSPANGSKDLLIFASFININFNEAVTSVAGKNMTISDGSYTYTYTIKVNDSNFSSNSAAIPFSSFANGEIPFFLNFGTTYTVSIDAAAVTDAWGNGNAAVQLGSFSTTNEIIDGTLLAVPYPAQGGVVSGSGVFTLGSKVTVTAIPNSGYKFVNWTGAVGESQNASYTFTFPTDVSAIRMTAHFEALPSYTVIFKDWNETILKTEAVFEGSGATVTSSPARQGYTFTGWDKEFGKVTEDMIVTAQYSKNQDSSSNVQKQEPAKVEITVSDNMTKATTTATANMDSSRKAEATVTQAQVNDAVNKAIEEAAKQGSGTSSVEVKVEAPQNARTIVATLPKTAVDTVTGNNIDALTVSTSIALITFDSSSLDTISGAATSDVRISAERVETTSLPEKTNQLVGNRPVFNFSVTSGNQTISQFGGTVTVSVPYELKDGEDPDAIVIYYINGEGNPAIVSHCVYKNGKVTFTTDHFSKYAVGYSKVTFKDVSVNTWYSKAVGFIAARGITTGTGNGNYSPAAKLTRGEMLVMIMRAYGIASDENPKDNFDDAGDTWYTGYLAAAKRLGISDGIGNNMFAPDKEITRQEMFTLLYNALKVIGGLPKGDSEKQLTDFSDAGQISLWAQNAMRLMVETGIIQGNTGRLTPTSTTTRAEMAQVLYNLLSK